MAQSPEKSQGAGPPMEPEMFMARLAEQAERYDDMFEFLQPVLMRRDHFTPEERSMLSVAFKNLVTPRRTTWRTINHNFDANQQGIETINKYKAVIEERLHLACQQISELLTQNVIPRVEKRHRDKGIKSVEERAFFYKMVGDYNRYAAESCHTVDDADARLDEFKQVALQAYSKSLELCNRGIEYGMQPYNPVRLGLALNFSVFYYEIIGNAKTACSIAKAALDTPFGMLDEGNNDGVNDAVFQEAQSIIELLRENLFIWSEEAEMQADEADVLQ